MLNNINIAAAILFVISLLIFIFGRSNLLLYFGSALKVLLNI